MTLAQFREGHNAHYIRHNLGLAPITRRPRFGWTVACACGWTVRLNEGRAVAESEWRLHTRELWKKEGGA